MAINMERVEAEKRIRIAALQKVNLSVEYEAVNELVHSGYINVCIERLLKQRRAAAVGYVTSKSDPLRENYLDLFIVSSNEIKAITGL